MACFGCSCCIASWPFSHSSLAWAERLGPDSGSASRIIPGREWQPRQTRQRKGQLRRSISGCPQNGEVIPRGITWYRLAGRAKLNERNGLKDYAEIAD